MANFNNQWQNTTPPDTGESPTLGASRIRQAKNALLERLAWLWGFATDDSEMDAAKSGAKWVPLNNQSAKPTAVSNQLHVYTKQVAGVQELFVEKPDGTEVQITSGGALNAPSQQLTILQAAYPVGCIYTSIVSTNPNTLFGFGTWAAFGAGRVLVGLDSGQTEFDTVEETGGNKTLDISHTHSFTTGGVNFGGGGSLTAGSLDTAHTHSGTTNTGGTSTAQIMNPYIVVYFFKRTA